MNPEQLLRKSLQLLSVGSKPKKDDDLEAFENWEELDVKRQYELVCKEINFGWSFPTISLVNLMKHKWKHEYDSANYQESALTLLQSQALSLRHQTLHQYFKRVSNNESDEITEMQQSIMAFHNEAEDNKQLMKWIESLPKNWRIVQMSIDDDRMESRFKKTPADNAIRHNFPLKLVVVECGTSNITVHSVSAIPSRDEFPSLQHELQEILKLHKMMYKASSISGVESIKGRYKETRDEVENRLKSLILVLENKWLGYNKVLLLGKSLHDDEVIKYCHQIQKSYFPKDENFGKSGRKELLRKVVDGFEFLSEDEFKEAILHIIKADGGGGLKDFNSDLLENVTEFSQTLIHKSPKRHPTVLILDKEIQGLPWESLGCLQNHSITRVPSVHQLISLYFTQTKNAQSVPNTGIHQDKIFYVLNPDQNLAKTQARLEPTLASMSIKEGIVGEQPTNPQMKKVLSEMDAFMYCGHGANLKNFTSQDIEKLNARAIPLLFGCNSGRLERLGRRLDPMGLVNHYLIATAPCTLGFLWSVTDKDVDNWTVTLLKYWIEGKREFVQSVAEKRCDFERMINRAAVVLYGLPSLKYT